MDGGAASAWGGWPRPEAKRWARHAGHAGPGPHRLGGPGPRLFDPGDRDVPPADRDRPVTLDGSRGEGGGQILRSALTLSALTGRPFRIVKIRANRDQPGLRPQHLKAVQAAAALCDAEVSGLAVGARELSFRPGPVRPRDLEIAIGTAGSTGMVLQTIYLPLALRAEAPVRVSLTGGTFNTKAPSFPFLETTWRAHLAAMGLAVGLGMPAAGFYPAGGGRIEAWISPGTPRPMTALERGPLRRIRGTAGVARLHRHSVAERMRDRALAHLAGRGLDAQIDLVEWPAPTPGAALSLSAEFEGLAPATFVGLGARGKPAEAVADEAVAELLAYLDAPGALDPHSADQVMLPLALAEGPSRYSVTEVTEHLRTNAATLRAFLDRAITVEEADEDRPGLVTIV